eukprot:227326-Alexandrium_andersonii.AAC.1
MHCATWLMTAAPWGQDTGPAPLKTASYMLGHWRWKSCGDAGSTSMYDMGWPKLFSFSIFFVAFSTSCRAAGCVASACGAPSVATIRTAAAFCTVCSVGLRSPKLARCTHCLLYTSDAADDMQCGDL